MGSAWVGAARGALSLSLSCLLALQRVRFDEVDALLRILLDVEQPRAACCGIVWLQRRVTCRQGEGSACFMHDDELVVDLYASTKEF